MCSLDEARARVSGWSSNRPHELMPGSAARGQARRTDLDDPRPSPTVRLRAARLEHVGRRDADLQRPRAANRADVPDAGAGGAPAKPIQASMAEATGRATKRPIDVLLRRICSQTCYLCATYLTYQ